MPQGMSILQRILDDIAATMGQGGAQIHDILTGYVVLFAALALVWVFYGLIWNGHVLPSAFGLLVRLALVTFAIHRWPWFLGGLRAIAANLGLLATGNQLQLAQFLDPGMVVKLGLDSGAVLWQAFQNNLGWTSFVTGLAFLLAWLGYVAAFAVMAYKVFWWQVELLIASLGGLCLLPTLAFRPTAFVAGGVLSYAANMAVRFLLGTILAGALWKHLGTLTQLVHQVPTGAGLLARVDFTIQEAAYATALAWVLAACFLSVNRLAGMLTSGVPGMAGGQSMGGLLRGMAVAGAALLTGGAAAAGGALGVGRAGAAGVQGLLGAGQAGWQAASGGGALRVGEAARQIYAGARQGMQGGAQAALGRYMGTAGHVAQRSSQYALQQYMRSGTHDVAHQGVRH